MKLKTIQYSEAKWRKIANAIDLLLDLEARQPKKEITSGQFVLLEKLIDDAGGHPKAASVKLPL